MAVGIFTAPAPILFHFPFRDFACETDTPLWKDKHCRDYQTPSGWWIRWEEYMNYTNTVSAAEDFKECPVIRTSEKNGTIYLVEYYTSEKAKETAYEKIKRLLLNDCEATLPRSVM